MTAVSTSLVRSYTRSLTRYTSLRITVMELEEQRGKLIIGARNRQRKRKGGTERNMKKEEEERVLEEKRKRE